MKILAAISQDAGVQNTAPFTQFEDIYGTTNYVASGFNATYSTLTLTIPSGIAFINADRVYYSGSSQTQTASKDAYYDLGSDGVVYKTEVTNGAAAPSLAANRLRLLKAVSNATAITSVSYEFSGAGIGWGNGRPLEFKSRLQSSGSKYLNYVNIGDSTWGSFASSLPGLRINASDGTAYCAVGQAYNYSIQIGWAYNATALNAYGSLSTYGGTNPIAVQASSVSMNSAGGLNSHANGAYLQVTGSASLSANLYPAVDNSGSSLGSASYRFLAVYATNGTIQTSDATLKENVKDLDAGLELINEIRPVSFDYKDSPGTRYGFIAQQVKQCMNDLNRVNVNLVREEENGKLTMAYHELIAPLVKAVQELSARVEALENK